MNFLVRKVQEVDILNPLCVSIVEIFESRAMNALVFFSFFVFFRAFVGLSFASSFPGGSAAQKSSSSGGKFSLLSFLSLRIVATHNNNNNNNTKETKHNAKRARVQCSSKQ
jgi:hypothetical protein